MFFCFSQNNRFSASLGTIFSQGIPIFPRENELISLGKMKIPWENGVPKLALRGDFWGAFGDALTTHSHPSALPWPMAILSTHKLL
jgi:hypothetical protein